MKINICILFFVQLVIFFLHTDSFSAWIEIFPQNNCLVTVTATDYLPNIYWGEAYLYGYSEDKMYKVQQRFSTYMISGSVYRDIFPDNEFFCQNHVPNYQEKPCVIPTNKAKCSSKEFWPTYFEFQYGGSNNVGIYWGGTFGGMKPDKFIRTWKSTCQNEIEKLSKECGGYEHIQSFDNDTCKGYCVLSLNDNLGNESCKTID